MLTFFKRNTVLNRKINRGRTVSRLLDWKFSPEVIPVTIFVFYLILSHIEIKQLNCLPQLLEHAVLLRIGYITIL